MAMVNGHPFDFAVQHGCFGSAANCTQAVLFLEKFVVFFFGYIEESL